MKIIPENDGCKIFSGNKVIGYVENQTLYGIDKEGYAVPICHIEQPSAIIGTLTEWRNKQL